MKVVLLDGSPAAPSRVGVLLAAIAGRLGDKGHETSVLELRTLNLPVNDPAYHANPGDHPDEVVRRFVAHIQNADAIVLGTPLYHGTFSGLLKAALDHLHNDAFEGKAVGLASNASGPRSAVVAAASLVPVARAMKGDVSNCMVGTCKADYGEKDGMFQIIEPAIIERVDLFAKELAAVAGRRLTT